MSNHFERNKKCLPQQNDIGPAIVGMERTEDKDISIGLFTLPKNTTSSQSSPKLNPGQLPGLWSGFTKAQIPLNTAGQSGFGRAVEGG